jgi:hypothetical protein
VKEKEILTEVPRDLLFGSTGTDGAMLMKRKWKFAGLSIKKQTTMKEDENEDISVILDLL